MDKLIKEALLKEEKRQNDNIELIASENYVSKDILELQGSIFTNKYAEGYPGKREESKRITASEIWPRRRFISNPYQVIETNSRKSFFNHCRSCKKQIY